MQGQLERLWKTPPSSGQWLYFVNDEVFYLHRKDGLWQLRDGGWDLYACCPVDYGSLATRTRRELIERIDDAISLKEAHNRATA